MPKKNSRLLQALMRQPVDTTPVWIMRQAGRYLPEYQASRKRAGDFLSLCKTPELACEVTLQPLARYSLDAAILFSDILTIPDAMGLGLSVIENQGPRFAYPIRSFREIKALAVPDPETELVYVMDAIRLIRRELNGDKPLIGFAGSPWTLATYMVEGQSSKDFRFVKSLLYNDPIALHHLLDTLSEAVVLYLNAQITAGVQTVMLFDTWGGILSASTYQEFSLEYMRKITNQLKKANPNIPVILFSKGAGIWLEAIAESGCDAIGIDWTQNIGEARKRVGEKVALQGNLDPCILYASPEVIRKEVAKVLADFGHGTGHVFNLGHGIQQHVDPEKLSILIDEVHEQGKQYQN